MPSSGANIVTAPISSSRTNICCLLLLLQSAPSQLPSVSQFISSVFGYEYSFRGWCLLIVLAYVVFFRVLGIIALRYVSFLKR